MTIPKVGLSASQLVAKGAAEDSALSVVDAVRRTRPHKSDEDCTKALAALLTLMDQEDADSVALWRKHTAVAKKAAAEATAQHDARDEGPPSLPSGVAESPSRAASGPARGTAVEIAATAEAAASEGAAAAPGHRHTGAVVAGSEGVAPPGTARLRSRGASQAQAAGAAVVQDGQAAGPGVGKGGASEAAAPAAQGRGGKAASVTGKRALAAKEAGGNTARSLRKRS